jgi:hypothetical protein
LTATPPSRGVDPAQVGYDAVEGVLESHDLT